MPDPIEVPEVLEGVDLEALSIAIRERADELAPLAASDDAVLAEIETLAVDWKRVQAAIKADRAAAALEALAEEAPEELVVDETVVEAAVEPAPAEVTEVVTEEASIQETVVPTPAVEAAIAPRVDEEPKNYSGAILMATTSAQGYSENTPLNTGQLATAITNRHQSLMNASVAPGTSEKVSLATATLDLPHKVGMNETQNFAVFEEVRSSFAREKNYETALVASGGVCAPLQQQYDFFRLAEPINPVEGSLPLVEAPRGGIRFISPTDYRDAAPGVRVTTEAEDAAGYTTLDPAGTTEPKPFVRLECPSVEEARVDAVSQQVIFGNLNYRVFPEQVESFLKDLAVIFTQTKEIFYLDAIDAASTAVTFSPDYSATRGITFTLLAAAANYRRRHHMPADSVLSLYLPSWVTDFLKADLIADHSLGMNFIGASNAQVAQVFASMNLDVNFYYDSATGRSQSFDTTQAAGAMNTFPDKVQAYLFSPGTFVRLNAGTLDLGIVRDSVLNGTNDLSIFSEEWIQLVNVGLESLRLEISLCPTGTGPEAVTPIDCASI